MTAGVLIDTPAVTDLHPKFRGQVCQLHTAGRPCPQSRQELLESPEIKKKRHSIGANKNKRAKKDDKEQLRWYTKNRGNIENMSKL